VTDEYEAFARAVASLLGEPTTTLNDDGASTHTWNFPSPSLRIDGTIVFETEDDLQAYLLYGTLPEGQG